MSTPPTKKMTVDAEGKTQVIPIETPATAPDASEKMSFFDDDEGDGLYSGTILLDGMAVRVRELSASEFDRYKSDHRAIDEIAKLPASDDVDFQEVLSRAINLLLTYEDTREDTREATDAIHAKAENVSPEAAPELAADAISALRRACAVRVIAATVTGWDLKRPDGEKVPFSREMAAKLRFSKQNELTEKIVQRSVFGADLSGFLAQS